MAQMADFWALFAERLSVRGRAESATGAAKTGVEAVELDEVDATASGAV
jgi:hypothetical protein